MSDQHYIGIDVSSESLDVCILPERDQFKVKNNAQGHEQLIDKLQPYADALIVLEGTGKLELLPATALVEAGFQVAVVNPRQMRDFAKAKGKLAKTDALDAEIIASFAKTMKPEPRFVSDKEREILKELVYRREQLVKMRVSENNRLIRTYSMAVKKSIESLIQAIDLQLQDLDRQIDSMIQNHEQWKKLDAQLRTMKGVGPQTSRMLIAALPELGHVNRHTIAAIAGLAPFNDDSGKFRGLRYIQGGRATVRKKLYMAALVAVQHNATLKTFYKKLLDKGKAKKCAIIACARKLLTILNSMVKNGSNWSCLEANQSNRA